MQQLYNFPVFLFIQVWQLGSSNPNFTLDGHEKGANCVDYYTGGDKPYLISGADDRLVKIWDYQVSSAPLPPPPLPYIARVWASL